MIELYNNENGQLLGSIDDEELRQLVDALEEESETDQDYYVDAATVDLIASQNASDHLVQLLRNSLGSSEGIEIRWQRR
jgi:hypothetical protein